MKDEKIKIQSIYFKKLKGLEEATFTFDKPVTAIMGRNGSGKSTLIHALACIYKKTDNGNGDSYTFPCFFIPNTDALWEGSYFEVENIREVKGMKKNEKMVFSKQKDRWTPKNYTNKRPARNIYYLGIETALPDIEKESQKSRIFYKSVEKSDKISRKIISASEKIFNKEYKQVFENTYKGKVYPGVALSNGLKYSSLFMAAGEQRVFRILEKVYSAEVNSLILIDEPELLLHPFAYKQLIKELIKVAEQKELQIVFTTHSIEVFNFQDEICIQYIGETVGTGSNKKTLIYEGEAPDLLYDMTGESEADFEVYVEDSVAEVAVKKYLSFNNLRNRVRVVRFGASDNAYTIAAAKVLLGRGLENTLILLDGDVDRLQENKEKKIQKKLTGNEFDAEDKRKLALSLVSQFNLPEGFSPEHFFYDLLIKSERCENDIYKMACRYNHSNEAHGWIYSIAKNLNDKPENIVSEIIDLSKNSTEWKEYIKPLDEWFSKKI